MYETLGLFAKAVEIPRSDEKFTRPKILRVPFASPYEVVLRAEIQPSKPYILIKKVMLDYNIHPCCLKNCCEQLKFWKDFHTAPYINNYTRITVILTLFQKRIEFESQSECIIYKCMRLCRNLAKISFKTGYYITLFLKQKYGSLLRPFMIS